MFEITPKRVRTAMSRHSSTPHAAVGLEVEASGAFGQFYFDEVRHQRIVLLAGGSGITPMCPCAVHWTIAAYARPSP